MNYPRRFWLQREADVSGVSGTGRVADGVQWADGQVVLHWLGARPSTSLWASLDDMLAIHGHGGATYVRWIDQKPDSFTAPAQPSWDAMLAKVEEVDRRNVWEPCEATDTLNSAPVTCIYRKGHKGGHWDESQGKLWKPDTH